ncbi:MAG: hypothetical protein WCS37_21775, partial [Chloroflexota bacterium]
MQGEVKKNDISKPEVDVDSRFSETLAAYFEQRNSGLEPVVEETSEELRRALALVHLSEKAAQDRPDVDKAWQMFRVRAFATAPAVVEKEQPVSLGGYVSGALERGQATKESGLPQETLEALREDHTPLAELKDFGLADYAALAKRYDVKENLFPRMLKWLKVLGKNFAAPSFGNGGLSRGMMYAREQE